MASLKRNYSCPSNYDLFKTCHTHGWINLDPFFWDKNEKRLSFAVIVDDQAVDISVKQQGRSIQATILSKKKIHYALIKSKGKS
jgi:hypothetical protein